MTESTEPETVRIEMELPDGALARWVIPSDDARLVQLEEILGPPDTLKP